MKKLVYCISPLVFLTFLSGCYTQVATEEPSDIPEYTTIQKYDSEGYYYEDDSDSSYFSEEDEIYSDGTTIINNYYDDDYYPWYRRYYGYYYPTFSIGIGFGFYYPFYWSSWCGYDWYYPYPYYSYPGYYYGYYGYCPSYYYYDYYCDPYPYYYSDGYYKTRSDYTTRLRNNTGGRGNGNRLRDPISTSNTIASTDRVRDFTNSGRDLSVTNSNGIPKSRNTSITTAGITDVDRAPEINKTPTKEIKRNDQIGMVDKNTTKTDKRLGQTTNVQNSNRKKFLGIDSEKKNTRTLGVKNPKVKNQSNDKITGRTGNTYTVPKKDYNNDKVNRNRNTTDKTKSPKQYSQQKNNNSPKSYSPPNRTNNNSPKSYSPPKNNSYNPPKTTSPPRNSGNNTNRSSGTNRSRR